jgi:hypothetical protein
MENGRKEAALVPGNSMDGNIRFSFLRKNLLCLKLRYIFSLSSKIISPQSIDVVGG